MPKLFIDEFVGISNRPETLPLAFAIRKAYGHEIILDWRELDSFSVDDMRQGKVRLATPISGFSHWAANALGGSTTCIVPLEGANPDNPSMGVVNLYGSRLPRWRAAGRAGTDTIPLPNHFDGVDLSRGANTGWL